MRKRLQPAVVAIAFLSAAACGGPASAPVKLTPVAALPPPVLPKWIASVSPTKNAQNLAQVRVIFRKPVVKVEALSGDGPQNVLSHFSIEPALKGHFTVLTPRMVGFVAEQALPLGTRARVTLSAGLADLDGDSLAQPLAWTFETDALSFSDLPNPQPSDGSTPAPVGTRPAVDVSSNAQVDTASLAAHATFSGGGDTIPADVSVVATPSPYPGSDAAQQFDPSLTGWSYRLKPQRDLHTATAYTITIAPGVEPAYGNVASSKTFEGGVRTYDPLAVVATPTPDPRGGDVTRFANGDPTIAFNNPLDPKSVAGAVTVSPAPAAVKSPYLVPEDSPNTIQIDPYALDPDKDYTVTIAGTVKDTFGQTLGADKQIGVHTGDFLPGAWAPTGVNSMPAGIGVDLNFYATNLPGARYDAAFARVAPEKLLGNPDPLAALPQPSTWPSMPLPGAKTNVQSVVRVPIAQQLGAPYGALAYGFHTALDAKDSAPGLTGIAQLTNLGVFAQWFPDRGYVLVQHLSDGAPAAGVQVTAYRNVGNSDGSAPQACASGTTGSDGGFALQGTDVERCYAGASSDQAPQLGVVASQGGDFAAVTTWSYSGVSRFSVYSGWSNGAPLSRGTIFSDREMYQPGERGEITGIAYYVSGSRILADRNATYAVTMSDPSNNSSSLGNVTTDEYGVFSLPLSFGKDRPLGYYSITAKGSNGNQLYGSVRLAEFKPPNFKLAVSLSAPNAPAGGSVKATATADYLFGAPLQGGTAHAYVTRDVASLAPKGWDDFWFGRQWFWPEQTPSFDTDVFQRDFSLDAQGSTSFDVGVPQDLPFPMTYRVDVETSDVSNLSVADSQSFLALPSDALIGLASDVVGAAATPMPIRTIVTDADGKPVAGRSVHLELQKMTYTSATQSVEGGDSADQSVKYDTVATADATSGQEPVTVNLTPPDAGSYRVRANFAGAKDDASATDIQVFAFGGGAADWGGNDANSVPVKLDKKKYKVGDTATALIGSAFASSDVYFSVVRAAPLYTTVVRGAHGAARVSFKVTQDMLPNAAVEAVVVRRGAPLRAGSSELAKGKLDALSQVGMTPFDVDVAGQYLKLAIAPNAATVTPASHQRVGFTLTSSGGTPARGEIVAMVVNDAILQLSGYRLPDLVQTVFASQPISTTFADSREGMILRTQTPPLEKGYGYGGGYLAGAGSTRVRANFLPMAYYGTVKTDASGKASVNFTMPDDLTTWRVMAVAVGSDDLHFATNDATFVSAQPLMTNPLLPQFARPGDRFGLGVSVANQTGAAGSLDLALSLTGALAFAQGTPLSMQTTEQAATGMQAYRFPVNVGTPAPTTVTAKSTLGAQSDAFTVPFTAVQYASTESVIESGATRANAEIPIGLDRGGFLTVTLANSVVPQFAAPSSRWMQIEGLPLADEAASRLIVASSLRGLAVPFNLKLAFDPNAQIATNLQKLLAMQRGDGGFQAYAGDRDSAPFETAYALQALAYARAHGVAVDAKPISAASAFMAQALANPGRFAWCNTDACKANLRFEALWSLAAAGDRRTDFLSDVVAQSGNFCSATQIRLARYLLQTPGWESRGAAMADHLQQTVYLTGRYATANVSTQWGWLGSLVDSQAQMLQLLLERHAPAEQTDGAVRALVAQQCKCGWPTMDDTATALMALVAYSAVEPPSAGSASATVGGTAIGSATFGSTASSQTFTVAASSLKGNAVTIAAKGPTVHYTVLYTYDVPNDAPGQLAAFRVIRTVGPPGGKTPIATMDIAPATAPVTVDAGQVFDAGIRVIVDHPVDRLVIEDPLPAGFEAVDTSFRTALQAVVPQSDSWDIDSQEIYRDRVVAFAQHLGPGIYEVHYLVRSVTPGTYKWPGARAYLVDAPEQFGRSASASLTVK